MNIYILRIYLSEELFVHRLPYSTKNLQMSPEFLIRGRSERSAVSMKTFGALEIHRFCYVVEYRNRILVSSIERGIHIRQILKIDFLEDRDPLR